MRALAILPALAASALVPSNATPDLACAGVWIRYGRVLKHLKGGTICGVSVYFGFWL
jgi:hypothetical protein